jgi:outer membrane protein insertion porin family
MARKTGAQRQGLMRGKMVGKRLLQSAAIAVIAAVSMPSNTFFTPAYAQGFSFTTVTVEGNERVDDTTVLSLLGIGRGESITPGDLNDATQRLINSGLFETVDLVPQGATLLVQVQEFPIVNVISIEGNRRVDDEKLTEAIKSEARRVYSPAQAEADAAAMTEIYRVTNRIAATVTPRIIRRSDNRVDLVFEVTEGRVVEVERLGFVGNRAFSDRRLRQILETKQAGLLRTFVQSDTFVAERLELDKQLLRDFYLSRGYIDFEIVDASAQISPERDASFVTFTVREGRPFAIGKVTTVSEVEGVDAATFDAEVRLRSGVTYSPAIIENNISRLEGLALQQGLNFVRIDPRVTRNDRDQTLDIAFTIVRGPKVFVERIDIEGNNTTLDQVIRRQFRTVEGDPFNPREVRQAAERIRALGYFADAQVESEQGSAEDQVVVNVDVEEQPTGTLSFGVGFGTQTGASVNVGLSESNFLGRGQRLSASVSTGTDNVDTSFSFAEPAFLGRDLEFGIGAYYRQTDQQNARYNTRNIGFTTSLTFPVSELGRLQVRYRLSQDRISDVPVDSSAILRREATFGALITSAVGYTYTYDNRIEGINPRGGVLLRFSQDFAGLGGDTKYVSTTALALAEQRVLNEEVTLRAVFEGGYLASFGDTSSRVTERFFGNGKIRGFEANGIGPRDLGAVNRDAVGGNAFAVVRFEADFPVGLPEEYGITAGAFLDVGSVWSLDDTAGNALVDDSARLRASIGVSVLWDTPVGPLRFNLSRPLKKEDYDLDQSFELTIATQF